MQRKVVIIGAAVALSVALSWFLIAQRQPEWTTRSGEALAQFELGIRALGKVYPDEAVTHFNRALELDPDFVMARLFKLTTERTSKDALPAREAAIEALKAVDPAELRPRERFLLAYYLKILARDGEGAETTLNAYLAGEPDDPFALDLLGRRQVSRRAWDAAEKTFQRLADTAPNRVEAYNQLGYLALARGDFAAGERMFRTYMYLAPDQANPRDSLAELLILSGRYDEAREQLEAALAMKPDFCHSYGHMLSLAVLKGSMEGVDSVIERAATVGNCDEMTMMRLRCGATLWRAMSAGDWEGVWSSGEGECAKVNGEAVPRFVAALRTGRRAQAEAWKEKYRTALEKEPAAFMKSTFTAAAANMQGYLLLEDRRPAEAAQQFAAADPLLTYRGVDDAGIFKLFNRQAWYQALVQAGQKPAAAALLAEIRAVNPPFAELTERSAR